MQGARRIRVPAAHHRNSDDHFRTQQALRLRTHRLSLLVTRAVMVHSRDGRYRLATAEPR